MTQIVTTSSGERPGPQVVLTENLYGTFSPAERLARANDIQARAAATNFNW